jgi:hypothetical protein
VLEVCGVIYILCEVTPMAFATIKEYIDSLDEQGQRVVIEFIDFMKAEYPGIAPKISYGMPMWWVGVKIYNGYVAISAAKSHYSVHFHDEERLVDLSGKMPNCTFGKRCVSVKYGDEKSAAIVKQGIKDYFSDVL